MNSEFNERIAQLEDEKAAIEERILILKDKAVTDKLELARIYLETQESAHRLQVELNRNLVLKNQARLLELAATDYLKDAIEKEKEKVRKRVKVDDMAKAEEIFKLMEN